MIDMGNPRNCARRKKRKGAGKNIDVKKSSSKEYVDSKKLAGQIEHGEGLSCVKHLRFMRESGDESEQIESLDFQSPPISQSFQKLMFF